VCQLYDTTTNARFRIRFYTGHTNGNVALTAATCAKPLSAKIVATGLGTGPWNYDWYYQDSLVAQNFQVNAADSINNLALGHWKLKINPSGTCLFYTKSFTVSAINYSTAKFELNHAELNLSQAEDLILTNTSLQSQAYRWSFGDGSACSSEFEPKHPYSAAGDYVITLRTESSTGCLDSVSKSIKVNKDVYETTGISSLSTTDEVNLKQNAEGAYSVFINLKKVQALKIVVSTLDGRLLQAEVVQSSKSLEVPIIKGDMGIQMYLISVQGETMNGRFKIIQ
jgi:PKD repeat protein